MFEYLIKVLERMNGQSVSLGVEYVVNGYINK